MSADLKSLTTKQLVNEMLRQIQGIEADEALKSLIKKLHDPTCLRIVEQLAQDGLLVHLLNAISKMSKDMVAGNRTGLQPYVKEARRRWPDQDEPDLAAYLKILNEGAK